MLAPSDAVYQVTPAGPDRIALLASSDPVHNSYTLYIVSLAPSANLALTVTQQDPTTVVLHFDSAAGATYRIETKSNLSASGWTTLQDNIAGTGEIIATQLAPSSQSTAFYRAVRLSQ
jgi:hypothetical protein